MSRADESASTETDGNKPLAVEIPQEVVYDEVTRNSSYEGKGLYGSIKFRERYLIPLLFAPAVAILTGLQVHKSLSDNELSVVNVSHTQISNVVASHLRSTILISMKDCIGIAELFSGDEDDISPKTFKDYVDFIDKDSKSYSYHKALEWVPYINSVEQRSRLESDMQTPYVDRYIKATNLSYPGFQFHSLHEGPAATNDSGIEDFPVYFIEPYEENIPVHGFDMGSHPIRLKAINHARESGLMVTTGRIVLVQENIDAGYQYGCLLFIPVYANGNFKGFASEAYRMGDVIHFALKGVSQEGVTLHLFDITGGSNELLYSDFAPDYPERGPTYENLRATTNVIFHKTGFGTREWELAVHRTEAFENERRTQTPIVAAVLLSIMLGTTVLFVCGLISKTLASKQHLQLVLEAASKTAAAVTVMDFDSVKLLQSLDNDAHPLLLAFRDIVNVLEEYAKFLPDVLRGKDGIGQLLTPTPERVHTMHATIAVSALSRSNPVNALINPHTLGVESVQLTAVGFALSDAESTDSATINTLLSAIHQIAIRRRGNVVTIMASYTQCIFTGYSITDARKATREVTDQHPETILVSAITQAKCIIGVAGGIHARYPVIHGKISSNLSDLMQYAQALNISTLCGNVKASLGPEDFNFVDRIKGDKCIYQLSCYTNSVESATWLFGECDDANEGYKQLREACILMFDRNYDAALEVLKLCPSCPLVRHHMLRAELKSNSPLGLSFVKVNAKLPVIVRKVRRKKNLNEKTASSEVTSN